MKNKTIDGSNDSLDATDFLLIMRSNMKKLVMNVADHSKYLLINQAATFYWRESTQLERFMRVISPKNEQHCYGSERAEY